MEHTNLVSRNPEIMSGEPDFAGTRVEVKTLVDYLKAGHTLDEFLDDFPTVSRDQAEASCRLHSKPWPLWLWPASRREQR